MTRIFNWHLAGLKGGRARWACCAALIWALSAQLLCAQQEYVGRFDVFGGFTYLDSPHINLSERGFHFQTGYRARSWLTLGFDYSVATGHFSLSPNLLTTALQQQLRAQIGALIQAGILPPTYTLSVPLDSLTHTFAAGPQLSYHGWKPVTLFIRPSIGAIHEIATPHAIDPVSAALIKQLAPSGEKTDWTAFYGFGGGVDINVWKHVALRVQADLVHDHLFSDLLKDSRNTVRFSLGPAVQFGPNARK